LTIVAYSKQLLLRMRASEADHDTIELLVLNDPIIVENEVSSTLG